MSDIPDSSGDFVIASAHDERGIDDQLVIGTFRARGMTYMLFYRARGDEVNSDMIEGFFTRDA